MLRPEAACDGLRQPHTKTHWQLQFGDMDCSPEDAAKIARTALEESINRHFVSDVPVAFFSVGDLTAQHAGSAKHIGHQDNQNVLYFL